jgi:ParB family chromosome partitioning protein
MIEVRNPKTLQPHPKNRKIYHGDSSGFDDMEEKVRKVGILSPILITKDNVIISGHRRNQVAINLGMPTVPVNIFQSDDPLEILEALVISNEQRERTNEQRIREFGVLRMIEEERARLRQVAELKQNKATVPENLPERTRGDSRDLAANRIGLSGKTAERGAEVVAAIDVLEAQGETKKAGEIREQLNKSVSGAHKAAAPIIQEVKAVKQEAKRIEKVTPGAALCGW